MADKAPKKGREDRLAQQLRANLLRRKQQARERDEMDQPLKDEHIKNKINDE